MQRFCGIDQVSNFRVDERAEDERADSIPVGTRVDLFYDIRRFLFRIEIRQGDFLEDHVFELAEQAVSQHFDRYAGTIRKKECRSVRQFRYDRHLIRPDNNDWGTPAGASLSK